MISVDGYDVVLTRGDDMALRVNLSGRELADGTEALFTIKMRPRTDESVLEKRFPVEDGIVVIQLTHDETDVTPRTYYWDLRLSIPRADGTVEVYTPMEYAAFTITDVIGREVAAT